MALTIGVLQLAANRTNPSSLNGNRSSKEPPPRVMMMTSTSLSASNSFSAALTWMTASAPCTCTSRISNCTDGHRRLAFSKTSFSASELRPQIKPILFGSSGNAFFHLASNKPSAAKRLLSISSLASSSPTPISLISRTQKEIEPFLVYQDGLAKILMRAFSLTFVLLKIPDGHAIEILISTLESRSTM